MKISGVHHIAYRCRNAQETVDFYTKILGLPYVMAISEDRVPSTHEPDPYMHIFFSLGEGKGHIAFFELPNSPAMGKDPNTPAWVQHLALEVPDMDSLMGFKKRVEDAGLEVIGPTDHGIFKSIYFFDPNGHRLELACNTGTPEMAAKLKESAKPMLDEWNRTHSTVKQAAWLHEKEFAET